MKKSFMTRVLATGLSLAMALSLSTATNLVTAEAGSKPRLINYENEGSGKTLEVKLNEVAKLKVNAATKETYKISAVKRSSSKIKAAVNKAGTVVSVRGMKATEEGKPASIKVSFKVKKTGKTSKYSFVSKVTVVDPTPAVIPASKIATATQKEATKVAVTFDNAVITKGAVSAYKIVRTEGNVVIPVKSVSYDADNKGATLETYTGMTDGKEYTVTFTDADVDKTQSSVPFTATDNKVADIKLDKSTIVAKTLEEVKIETYDAQNVKLASYSLTGAESNKMSITVKSADNTGYRAGDKLYIAKTGDVLTVDVTLHTYKYENGVEVDTIPRSFTVTGADEDLAAISYGYTIAKNQPNFTSSSYKQNTSIAKSTSDNFVWFNFKKGNDDKKALFTVESSDNNVAIIAKTKLDTVNKVPILPVNEGSAYILVKNGDNLVTTLPFTVTGSSKATTISLSATNLVTSDAAGVDQPTSKVTVKDQYGNELKITKLEVKATDTTTSSSSEAITTPDPTDTNNKTIKVDGTQAPAGKTVSYTYKVTATTNEGTLTSYLTVTINHAIANAKAASYDLILSTTSVDLAVKDTDSATYGAVTFKIGKYDSNGSLMGYLDIVNSSASITCTRTDDASSTLDVVTDGKYKSSTSAAVAVVKAVSKGAFASDKTISKKAVAGKTYQVTAEFTADGQKVKLVKAFDVKDSQGEFTFKVNDLTKGTGNIVNDMAAGSNVEYYIGSDKIDTTKTGITVESVDAVKSEVNGKTNYAVKSVTFEYKVGTTSVYVTAKPANGVSSVYMTQQ